MILEWTTLYKTDAMRYHSTGVPHNVDFTFLCDTIPTYPKIVERADVENGLCGRWWVLPDNSFLQGEVHDAGNHCNIPYQKL